MIIIKAMIMKVMIRIMIVVYDEDDVYDDVDDSNHDVDDDDVDT